MHTKEFFIGSHLCIGSIYLLILLLGISNDINRIFYVDFKLEKGPTDKAKEPDPGGSWSAKFGIQKTEKQKNWPYNRTVSFSVFQFFVFSNSLFKKKKNNEKDRTSYK